MGDNLRSSAGSVHREIPGGKPWASPVQPAALPNYSRGDPHRAVYRQVDPLLR
jgi:hypothetical protein